MFSIADLLKEVPLSAVLKERVALAEQKYKNLEAENQELGETVKKLSAENDTLRKRVQALPAVPAKERYSVQGGCYRFEGDPIFYCPNCYHETGKKYPANRMGSTGRMCVSCRRFIPKHNL
jgi:hypothetical protein